MMIVPRITVERAKFDYIGASLSPSTATEVQDLIITPPADNPYTVLKAELCKRTAGSNQQKFQRLLNYVELGNRKPSQLLRYVCVGVRDTRGQIEFLSAKAIVQTLFEGRHYSTCGYYSRNMVCKQQIVLWFTLQVVYKCTCFMKKKKRSRMLTNVSLSRL